MTAATKATFTPGPWKVVCGGAPNDFIVAEPTGNTICEPNEPLFSDLDPELEPGIREITQAEALANAQLIAAAPEMYELLQGFAYMVAAHGETEGFRIMQRRAQEVLAKAEGPPMTALPAHDVAAMFTADDFRAQLLHTAKKLHEAGLAARHLLANWPGTDDEQRRIDHAEFAALEFLASDALFQAERLMKLHERDEL